MSDKNTVKNSKKRQLSWPGVGETCAAFSFPSCLHIRAGVLRRAATWKTKIRENTEVGGGRSFGQWEYWEWGAPSTGGGFWNSLNCTIGALGV